MNKTNYHLDPEGRFIIENYNASSPFASFLPGIAGERGIPAWAFYVNRGQALASFGVRNKDGAMLEFFPADKAYQMVTLRGFRTFLKIGRGPQAVCYEPFQRTLDASVRQRMIISPEEVAVEETHARLGLRFRAVMFTLANAPVAGLVRVLTIDNIGKSAKSVEVVDGLPQVLSFGLNQYCVKNMSRTMEAFAVVENLAKDVPFFKLKVYPADSEKVQPVVAGHFFAGFQQWGGKFAPTPAVVDGRLVFGDCADFTRPARFWDAAKFSLDGQVQGNQNPSGFQYAAGTLAPRAQAALYGLYGHALSLDALNNFTKGHLTGAAYFDQKREENRGLIRRITRRAFTRTSEDVFNAYAEQCFLDNGLRGGFSIQAPGGAVLYLFGRKHGDLERDYNEFLVQDTFFSEGNGDFRDVLQNRRCELFFNPAVADRNVKYFFNLIQPDGYNPLVLRNTRFWVADPKKLSTDPALAALGGDLEKFTASEFKFAALWAFLSERVESEESRDALAGKILRHAEEVEDAEFEKGYWSDHWTYLVDLLENFAAVYPEKVEALFLDDRSFTFYDPTHFVRPRNQKYVLTERGVRQYGAVSASKEKQALIKARPIFKHRVRAKQGQGDVVRTTLLVKVLTLVLNKLASLDPAGAGIEMEADRPGWCDALNGLPGLLGSALNETIELKRLVDFSLGVLRAAGRDNDSISLPTELGDLLAALRRLIQDESLFARSPLRFWDESHDFKEKYREKVFFGFDGQENELPLRDVAAFLEKTSEILSKAVSRGQDAAGRVTTYFSHEALSHEKIDENRVRVKEFRQKPLPIFLEGFVHALRLAETPAEARKLYDAVNRSELYDRSLKMYRLNAPLGPAPYELGRIGIFAYGWLENGSIFSHMHYKFVLEMARRGLLDEFYKNMQSLLVPFRDPAEYRRSVTENASFIASSGYTVDPGDQGKGFVARLSGSTVEFLHLWSFLMAGPAPFVLTEGKQPAFQLRPNLHKDLFLKAASEVSPWEEGRAGRATLPKNSLAFRFLGGALIVYHNPSRKNTFGPGAARPREYRMEGLDGRVEAVAGERIVGPWVNALREGRVKRVDVTLG